MAYTLTTDERTSLNSELTNLQSTLNGYDSSIFIAGTNNGVDQAQEVDDGFAKVFTSLDLSVDGVVPRETEVTELIGLVATNPVKDDTVKNPQDPSGSLVTRTDFSNLIRMGEIAPVIEDLQPFATILLSSNIENSDSIRLNINRYYPDVDNFEARVSGARFPTNTTDIFPGPTWFAFNTVDRNRQNIKDNNTTFFSKLVPSTSFGSNTFINDSDRFYAFYIAYLGAPTTSNSGSTAGTNTSTAVSNGAAIRGTAFYGTATLSSVAMGSGTSEQTTFLPAINNTLTVGSGQVRVTVVTGSNVVNVTTGESSTPPNPMTTSTRTTTIEFIKLNTSVPSVGSVSFFTPNSSNSSALRTAIQGIRHYPLLDSITEVEDQATLVADTTLGFRNATGLYQMRLNTADARANWSNGSLSLLEAKKNGRLNLFNPQQLVDQGLIPSGQLTTFINEYTRTRDRITFISAVLAGSS